MRVPRSNTGDGSTPIQRDGAAPATRPLARRVATVAAASAMVVLAACSAPRSPMAVGSNEASTAMLGGIAYNMTAPDAQMQAVLDQLAALGGKPIEKLSAAEARQQPTPADAVKALLARQGKSTAPEPVARVINDVIQGPGGPIKTRIYYPMNAGPAPLPVVLYIHGGGWVIADIDVYDSSPRALANAAKAIVVSTEYRHAPEAKFPAAHDDTWAAWQWTLSHAAVIGGDPKRIAVAGESAGGNMAAAIALRARDQKMQGPVAQLLVYPVVDAAVNSPSEKANTMSKPLNSPMLTWFYNQYLGSPADANNPYFNLLAADLSGVAPVTLVSANIDPLNTEDMALVQRYKAAGVPVQTRDYPGVTHEFFGMGAAVDKAKDAVMFGAMGLRQGFDAAPR